VILSLARQGARSSVAIVLGLTLAYTGVVLLALFMVFVVGVGILLPVIAIISIAVGRR
jgi:hypothetical protein